MSNARRHPVSLGFATEKFPAGTHMCYIYNDDNECRTVASKFIESGVAAGEETHYLCHGPEGETLEAARERLGLHLPAEGAAGILRLAHAIDTYCPGGTFVPERMLARLRELYLSSIESGYTGARVSGEMGWALKGLPGTNRLIEYEARVNLVVAEYPCTALCQYDARRFDGATLFHVLSVHPAMVVRGQVVRNPYYIPPEQFLAAMRAAE